MATGRYNPGLHRRVTQKVVELEKAEAEHRAEVAKKRARQGLPPHSPTRSAYKLMKGHHKRTWGRKGRQNKAWSLR